MWLCGTVSEHAIAFALKELTMTDYLQAIKLTEIPAQIGGVTGEHLPVDSCFTGRIISESDARGL